ncbi:MAG TPA: anti-sigma factor [Kribbella sp.]|nr:anti-sigma factor [Kribbella sp.]
MAHLEPELLAQYALGDDVSLDTGEHGHLAGCDVCRAEVDELRRLAELGHELESGDRLEPAPQQVWNRIAEELGLPEATPSYQASIARQRERRSARTRMVLVGAVAAALGLIAGVLGVRVLGDDTTGPEQQPLASTRLDPLAGKTGDGTADLLRVGADTELRVDVSGLPAPQGFYELWLINADGKRMVSLGVLDPRTGGTFLVPADLTAQGYTIVDISLEPYDGKPEHSRDSVIRGTLPA